MQQLSAKCRHENWRRADHSADCKGRISISEHERKHHLTKCSSVISSYGNDGVLFIPIFCLGKKKIIFLQVIPELLKEGGGTQHTALRVGRKWLHIITQLETKTYTSGQVCYLSTTSNNNTKTRDKTQIMSSCFPTRKHHPPKHTRRTQLQPSFFYKIQTTFLRSPYLHSDQRNGAENSGARGLQALHVASRAFSTKEPLSLYKEAGNWAMNRNKEEKRSVK